ncbi:MAG TPA: hypothetical protein IAD03_07580 [Candidatus Caccousia stercoris]|uniref:Uncharacterized protein n=1 Tax=Candidatus Caccousia stercoris TaxID=2840723 RepID=A0A9D1FSZ5_9FIRM|nr:hypothetical protein [Candidatus Caccousia stercoris]
MRRKAAKRRLATEQLAIFDCETVLVRWGTALQRLAITTQPLKHNFPGEVRKIEVQSADRQSRAAPCSLIRTQPLKRNFPGEARKIMLQTADRR